MIPLAIDSLGDLGLKILAVWLVVAFIAAPLIGQFFRRQGPTQPPVDSDYWDYITERREADQRARERAQAMAKRRAS